LVTFSSEHFGQKISFEILQFTVTKTTKATYWILIADPDWFSLMNNLRPKLICKIDPRCTTLPGRRATCPPSSCS
jgi:hypothetical protein